MNSHGVRVRSRRSGFTYVECLAALAIIGLAIVAADGIFVSRPGLETRLEARSQVTRALELALETARGGAVSLVAGEQVFPLPVGAATAAPDLGVTLRTRALQPAGLWEVRALARWQAGTRACRQELVTMVWRQP